MPSLGLLAAVAGRRPRAVAAVWLAVGAGCAAAVVGLAPSVGVSSFLGGEGTTAAATQVLDRAFGEEPLLVVVRGELQRLLVGENLKRLDRLERCLAGELAGGGYPCKQLAAGRYTKSLIGPATLVYASAQRIERSLGGLIEKADRAAAADRAAVERRALAAGEGREVAQRLGREAQQATLAAYAREAQLLALRFGLYGPPAPSNPAFVLGLLFRDHGASPLPKPQYSFLLPTPRLALVVARLRSGLSEPDRRAAVGLVRAALRDPAFALEGGTYAVGGEPVLVGEVGESMAGELLKLVLAALAVAGFALALVFKGRPRLLALAVALQAGLVVLGVAALATGALSLAALALAPALIGLGVDYALQVQAASERELGRAPLAAVPLRMAERFGPILVGGGAASAASLLALLISPLGLIRGFALLFVAGVVLALVGAVSFGSALFVLDRSRSTGRSRWLALARAWGEAQELVVGLPVLQVVARAGIGWARARRGLAVGGCLALAALGVAVGVGQRVQTEPAALLPSNLGAVQTLRLLEREAGFGADLELLVEGPNLLGRRDLAFIASFERRVLRAFGGASCAKAALCPTFSLAGLPGAGQPSRLRGLIDRLPAALRDQLVSANHRLALISFAQRLQPPTAERRLIDRLLALAHPPPGVRVRAAGILAAAAQEGSSLSSAPRRLFGELLALLLGFGALAAVTRSPRMAAAATVFSLIALGWSNLAVWLLGVAVNPLSTALGAVVVAVGFEFAALLGGRYRELRDRGSGREAALGRAYATTGVTVASSGVAVIAGFGVLALAPIPLLAQFGLGTVVELCCLELAVFLALPALLLAFDPDPATPGRRRRRRPGAAARPKAGAGGR